ncbi:hypothetical protein NE237_029669 [Protea cynaroides]|uniref:Uncharacterized protein n=1 Tax=Protea cynaroides TaxID=273540 RepID=A0A9Q0GRM6_9MAGN|nr:hypothetical protein NE237_029669 [Protea cynaroides]
MLWFCIVLLACSRMQFKLGEVYGSVRMVVEVVKHHRSNRDRMHMSCTLAHVLTSSLLFLALGKMMVGSITSALLSTYLVLGFIVYVDFMLIGHVLDGLCLPCSSDCLGMELEHFCKLNKGKTKVIELLRESRPEYYIDSIQKSIKKKKKRKKLSGSIGTQYSWCSSHVKPMPMAR